MKIKVLCITIAALMLMPVFASCRQTPTAGTNGPESVTEEKTPASASESAALPTSGTQETSPSETETGKSETPTPTETPTPPEKRVSFLAAGDNIIHEAVFTDAKALAATQASQNGYTEKYYFDSMYNGVSALIANADIAFVNHECPVAGEQYGISGYPSFNSPFEALEALERVGFDVLNLANNHMLDMEGKCTGYQNTLANAKKTKMLVIGGYTPEDYDDLRVIEKNGVKIAFLSYTDVMNGGRKKALHSGSNVTVPYADETTIRRQTALARANADFVVVSMHWGTENSFTVDKDQKKYANLLNECGVDVILGHHSHTIQPVEWVGGGDHKTLCFWSLGNFLSTQHPIKNLTGIFGCFDFYIDDAGGKHIENVRAVPHMTWYSMKRDSLQVYLLANVTEELISTHGSQLRTSDNGGNFTLSTVKRYVEEQVGQYLDYAV